MAIATAAATPPPLRSPGAGSTPRYLLPKGRSRSGGVQFPMPGAVLFATPVACRVALGRGEGPAAPVALRSAYKWFPNELRTLPIAVIVQGGAIGFMVALPLLNWVIMCRRLQSSAAVLANKHRFLLTIGETEPSAMLTLRDPVLAIIRSGSQSSARARIICN